MADWTPFTQSQYWFSFTWQQQRNMGRAFSGPPDQAPPHPLTQPQPQAQLMGCSQVAIRNHKNTANLSSRPMHFCHPVPNVTWRRERKESLRQDQHSSERGGSGMWPYLFSLCRRWHNCPRGRWPAATWPRLLSRWCWLSPGQTGCPELQSKVMCWTDKQSWGRTLGHSCSAVYTASGFLVWDTMSIAWKV